MGFFKDKFFLRKPGWLKTYCVDQSSLKLVAILLSLLPKFQACTTMEIKRLNVN